MYYLLQYTELIVKIRNSKEQETVLTVNWVHLQLELTSKFQCLFRLHNERIVHATVRVIWKKSSYMYIIFWTNCIDCDRKKISRI